MMYVISLHLLIFRVIKLIEDVMFKVVMGVSEGVPPQLTIRSTSRWENITFDKR